MARNAAMCKLRVEIKAFEDNLRALDEAERELIGIQKQASGWLAFFIAPFAEAETGERKAQKREEILQQRTRASVKIGFAKEQLKRQEAEHQRILNAIRQAELEEQFQKSKEENARREREREMEAKKREESMKRAEAARKEAEKQARARAAENEARDKERRERDLRQALHAKLAKEKAEAEEAAKRQQSQTRPPANTSTPKVRVPKASRNAHTHSTQSYPDDFEYVHIHQTRSRAQTRANHHTESHTQSHTHSHTAQTAPGSCRHTKFWPKVMGSFQCSVCSTHYHAWILQCPDCSKLACASCQKQIRGPRY